MSDCRFIGLPLPSSDPQGGECRQNGSTNKRFEKQHADDAPGQASPESEPLAEAASFRKEADALKDEVERRSSPASSNRNGDHQVVDQTGNDKDSHRGPRNAHSS